MGVSAITRTGGAVLLAVAAGAVQPAVLGPLTARIEPFEVRVVPAALAGDSLMLLVYIDKEEEVTVSVALRCSDPERGVEHASAALTGGPELVVTVQPGREQSACATLLVHGTRPSTRGPSATRRPPPDSFPRFRWRPESELRLQAVVRGRAASWGDWTVHPKNGRSVSASHARRAEFVRWLAFIALVAAAITAVRTRRQAGEGDGAAIKTSSSSVPVSDLEQLLLSQIRGRNDAEVAAMRSSLQRRSEGADDDTIFAEVVALGFPEGSATSLIAAARAQVHRLRGRVAECCGAFVGVDTRQALIGSPDEEGSPERKERSP